MRTIKFISLIAATAIPALASAQTVSSDVTAQLNATAAPITEVDQFAAGETNPGDRTGVIYNSDTNPGDREGVIFNKATQAFDIAGGETNPGDRTGVIYNSDTNPGDREGVIFNVDYAVTDIA